MQQTFKLLNRLLRRGFCLHGSRVLFQGAVEPRQASCGTGHASNCQRAVYASLQIAEPCFMAMWKQVDLSRSCRGRIAQRDGVVIVEGENMTFAPGYVYVLPTHTFLHLDGSFISYEPVHPHEIIQVTPDIIPLLQNVDLRIPVPA